MRSTCCVATAALKLPGIDTIISLSINKPNKIRLITNFKQLNGLELLDWQG
jgi:hypothetical protein